VGVNMHAKAVSSVSQLVSLRVSIHVSRYDVIV
jgi:hypothetical protein